MLKLELPLTKGPPLKILCLGAHSDDIEIGCGGTLLRVLREWKDTEVHWVVFGAEGERAKEAEAGANVFLKDAGRRDVRINRFRDGFFPYIGGEIKEYFERLKQEVWPDLIFTHCRHDLHQDHRLVSELTWNTFRDHLILEYEIFKYDGDMGNPNFFVHLSREICQEKLDHIGKCFLSQNGRKWFAQETLISLLRLRGIESNAPDKYAEGFYCRKVVI